MENGFIFLIQRRRTVNDRKNEICFFHGCPRPFDPDLLYLIVRFPQTGGIHKKEGNSRYVNRLFNGVPRRARHIGDNRPFFLQKGIQQG